MLEEMNDNLLNADGILENSIDKNQMATVGNFEISEEIEKVPVTIIEKIATIEPINIVEDAVKAIEDVNAAESEDETLKERHEIPVIDYEALTMEDLVNELEKLGSNEKVMAVKDHVEEIKNAFLSKFQEQLEEKRASFESENNDINEEFKYNSPLKKKFDTLYSEYRDRKNKHFNNLQTNLQQNLENRLAIVEELKTIVSSTDNIPNALKKINEIRDRWKNAGPIPKDKYNHVWNNYHFHIENFYDFLHLDREARDIDFKHNLDLKNKIINRCEALLNEPDINKAFRELQDLHKIWKEDIGPVSREFRDTIWNKFSELTKEIHTRKERAFEKIREIEFENLKKKKEIISKIEELATVKVDSHNLWLKQIDKIEVFRNEFIAAGKVPIEVNENLWKLFKTAVKDFNTLKNSFYKDIKKEQNDNLEKKQTLLSKAIELQESDDFTVTTPIMKQIQEEWKTIGHVPRKFSDELWSEFRAACNHYFEKVKESRNAENEEEVAAFENKKKYLEIVRVFEMTGDHKTDLEAIKSHIDTWKSLGRVPFARRHLEAKFNKILDTLFEQLSLSKKDSEMMRFSNRIEQLSDNNDTRKLDNEKIFLQRKIEEVQSEIFQLENNIQFFSNAKNTKKENPIVIEVRKNIEKHKAELEILKQKQKQLKNLNQE